MRIKKRYIVMVVCWVIFIIVALYLNSRGENKYNFTYMNQAALIIDSNYDGKIELITPNSELTGSEKAEKKTVIANTYVYSNPDSSSSYCGELLKGDEVLVYSSADGWFKVSYNGRVAYVLSAAIEAPEEPTTPQPTTKPTQAPTTKPTQAPTTKPTTPAQTEPTQEPTTPEESTTGSEEEPTTPEEPTTGSEEATTDEEETSGSGDENPTEAGGEVPSGEPSSSEDASEEESGDGETSGSEDDLMEESFE